MSQSTERLAKAVFMVVVIAVAGCKGSSESPTTTSRTDAATIPSVDCSDVSCRPPTCCGTTCTKDSDCCAETICSTGGQCVPAICRECGRLGCNVDLTACTASCARPPTCLGTCSSNTDCDPGMTCQSTTTGSRCLPEECSTCSGATPRCLVDASCQATCAGPETCGTPCTSSTTCGSGSVCRAPSAGAPTVCMPSQLADECTACGRLGCAFDATACTMACARAPVCLGACSSGADCDPGSHCAANSTGTLLCFPDDCSSCGGLRPQCQAATDCSSTCVAPPTCGMLCTSSTECGSLSECLTFQSGEKRCVPLGLQAECNSCVGTNTCTVYFNTCDVVCDVPDGGMPSADAGTPDASRPSDGGSSCTACCQSCTTDSDCCAGMRCGSTASGGKACVPSECAACTYGCDYVCP